MNQEVAYRLIQDTFQSLQRTGMIEEGLTVSRDIVILGNASVLDSLAFVTFISDLEERLCDATGKDLFLVLNDIHEFNSEQTFLSIGILSDFIQQLAT